MPKNDTSPFESAEKHAFWQSLNAQKKAVKVVDDLAGDTTNDPLSWSYVVKRRPIMKFLFYQHIQASRNNELVFGNYYMLVYSYILKFRDFQR